MSTINLAVTKWLESGELCSAMVCGTTDLREFARENQMYLEADQVDFSEEERQGAPHEVPIGIFSLSLKVGDHDFGNILDALMYLSDSMMPGEGIDRMLEQLMFEAFKAGMKFQADQEVKPIIIVP